MKGMPKHLNSKKDYENIRTCGLFTEAEWKAKYQAFLDSRFVWQTTGELLGSDEGTTDDTHRVISQEAESGTIRYQQQLVEDENARIFRLGFTVSEVEGIIGG